MTHPLNVVIRAALAEHGITSLRATEDAIGIGKDAINRRYKGETAWTLPDLEKVAAVLGIPASELVALTEDDAA